MRLTHTVTRDEAGMTLQHLLRSVLGLSSRQTRIAKQQGAVTVDDAPFFANQTLHEGMIVRVQLSGYAQETVPLRTALPAVRVLYEDEALIAVFKPALLQCHPSPSAPGGSDTLEARVSMHLKHAVHPVHRLDAETTGIVLFAKLPFAQAHLQEQMRNGSFHKEYRAWCFGMPPEKSGIVSAPIAREHPDSFTRVVRSDGQHAVSRYEALKTLSLPGGKIASLLALSPLTGRTHQLRVHMAHIGCPLLGDQRYHTEQSRAVSDALGLTHHQLSAVALSFLHPLSAAPVQISCDPVFSISID